MHGTDSGTLTAQKMVRKKKQTRRDDEENETPLGSRHWSDENDENQYCFYEHVVHQKRQTTLE